MTVSSDDYALLTSRFRLTSPVEDAALKTADITARDVTINGRLVNLVDADAERDRQWAIEKKTHKVFTVPFIGGAFTYRVGQTITIKHPRFGLSAGKDGIIIGVENRTEDNSQILTVEVEI